MEVPLDAQDGMPTRCVVKLDDILTIPKHLLQDRITTLSREKMVQVDIAVAFALDLQAHE